VKNVYEV